VPSTVTGTVPGSRHGIHSNWFSTFQKATEVGGRVGGESGVGSESTGMSSAHYFEQLLLKSEIIKLITVLWPKNVNKVLKTSTFLDSS
jgi:hypothetical protein